MLIPLNNGPAAISSMHFFKVITYKSNKIITSYAQNADMKNGNIL